MSTHRSTTAGCMSAHCKLASLAGCKLAHCRLAPSLVVVAAVAGEGVVAAEEGVVAAAEGGSLPGVRRWGQARGSGLG